MTWFDDKDRETDLFIFFIHFMPRTLENLRVETIDEYQYLLKDTIRSSCNYIDFRVPFREVFQCSVLICLWRVRHAWHKNVVKKCPEIEMRAEISRQLGRALHNISKGFGAVDLFDGLMEDFVDASDFVDYFKAVWYPRICKAFSF